MKKNIFALLLCGLLLCFASCSETIPDEEKQSSQIQDTQIEEAETEELTEEEKLYRSLPKGNFNGYECHLAQYIFGHLSNMSKYQVTVDETYGEIVNDTLYNVSRSVEENLNTILVTDVYTDRKEMRTALDGSIAAGDNMCDAFFSLDAFSYFNQGSILNMSSISTMDFDNIWWNKSAIDSVRLTNSIYLGYGSLSTMQYSNLLITQFNKTVADNIGMEDPYTLVRENRWTLDVMKKYIELGTQDLNGDGKINVKYDVYGYASANIGMFKMLYGSGVSIFGRNEEGVITYLGVDDKFDTVMNTLSEIFSDNRLYYEAWSVNGKSNYHLIESNQALFSDTLIVELEELRDMEDDYGVIPGPKYDENQDEYISYIYSDCAPLAVPMTVIDAERTGTILENLCAETYLRVKDVYLEDMLNNKLLRDRDSIEMMNIILGDKVIIDPCYIYNWGGVNGVIVKAMKQHPSNIVSGMAAIDQAVIKGIEDSVALAD